MKYTEAKTEFIQAWGTLGTHWGINRTMAQIHALMLLSPHALSTEEIMDDLKISRGNANMNIRALMDWGIVKKELKPGDRKDYFYSGKDMWELSKQVARERRRREVEPVLDVLRNLKNMEGENNAEVKELKKVVKNMDDFTKTVDSLLDKYIRSDEHWFTKGVVRMIK